MANLTLRAESVPVTPLDTIIDLQGWLERAGAIVDLAARDIDDRSSGCTVLGVVENILANAVEQLEAVEIALKQAGMEA